MNLRFSLSTVKSLAILMALLLSMSLAVAPGVAFAQTVEDPIIEDPIDEEPIDEEPIDEEPIDEEPIDEEPIDEEPIDEEPIDEEPIDEEPIDEEPIDEEPIDEEPIDEEPIDEEPIDEEPIDEEPIDEEPIDEEPIDEEPIDEEPIDEEPIDEEPIDPQPERRSDKREVQATWSVHRWIALNIDRPYVQLGESNGEENLEVKNANTMSVIANTPWVLTVQAASDTITYRGEGADPSKPVSHFFIRTENGGDYRSMSGPSGEAIVVNEGDGGSNQTKVDYLVEVSDVDPSGEYSVVLVYTATTR